MFQNSMTSSKNCDLILAITLIMLPSNNCFESQFTVRKRWQDINCVTSSVVSSWKTNNSVNTALKRIEFLWRSIQHRFLGNLEKLFNQLLKHTKESVFLDETMPQHRLLRTIISLNKEVLFRNVAIQPNVMFISVTLLN